MNANWRLRYTPSSPRNCCRGKVVGVRVALAKAKPEVVNQLVKQARLRKALARLAATFIAAEAAKP